MNGPMSRTLQFSATTEWRRRNRAVPCLRVTAHICYCESDARAELESPFAACKLHFTGRAENRLLTTTEEASILCTL